MSGLFGTLSISLRGLLAQQASVENASENIANINTPGYARRRVNMQEDVVWSTSNTDAGRGVRITGIESLRDRVLELRILSEVQSKSRDETFVSSMQPVESAIGDTTNGIGAKVASFFDSIQALSATPLDSSLRSNVLMAAQNLAASFRTASAQIINARQQVDRDVVQSVQEINRISSQIAQVNTEVATRKAVGTDPGAFEDRRGVLMRQLSELVDFSTVDSGDGLSLTTSNGIPLVVGDKSYDLSTSAMPDGTTHIFGGQVDVTSHLEGGKIGGLLQVRDGQLAHISTQLDQFASEFVTNINSVHRAGFDLNGDAGGDLFVPFATVNGAAGAMTVAITDPKKVAGSEDGKSGDNKNLLNLLGVEDTPFSTGLTPTQQYAEIVFGIGSAVADHRSEAEAGDIIVRQLDDQRGAISGVSLDEEAANLLRFQRAYEASARVVSITNELLETVINLGRN